MAGKANDIQDEITKRREGIAEARLAITGKLAVLDRRVRDRVDDVKHAFDLRYQVKQRPWLMFGVSMLVGYALRRRGGDSIPALPLPRSPHSEIKPSPHIMSDVRTHLNEDLATFKGAVFGAVISTLWAMARQVLLSPARPSDAILIKPDDQPRDRLQTVNQVVASKANGRSAE